MMENVVYTAPVVEVIEVEVEKGFATRGGAGDSTVDPYNVQP